jgi:hypothetical protein
MFRSLMGSSSGDHITVKVHKTKLAIHVHDKNMYKSWLYRAVCLAQYCELFIDKARYENIKNFYSLFTNIPDANITVMCA